MRVNVVDLVPFKVSARIKNKRIKFRDEMIFVILNLITSAARFEKNAKLTEM